MNDFLLNNNPTKQEILAYEIGASWWPGFIGIEWMRNLAGKYFAYKVNRKYARFKASQEMSIRVHNMFNHKP